ncbi:16S rRNA (guanine(966)-N(2))-methyltransferase RsmD [Chelatococcus asaccharovorans]|uniref:16S rRNA (guanine(966)-N(2))-methyltransferase RsmD n=1 Tax=Chelatococcus asaccharovorans TaxID=28210 RepID=UPI00224C652E|nr:16S rRNA (guanine(966)-N(2))-methyltransferase RsmD [Chelatococcus asaccharovorans]CAH1668883.1 putative 16S rRNA (guanine(966)-N(2))-methyltransferase [Chelatococcus asaccharovorans]CAH1679664.1 putative 16S rRNA (guanine(966)-N(2))-methyltransferase [Chelatococcus asaccharovorans]
MRIVGGQYKGRSLAAPKSHAIRPTSDRLRESIFNVLAHAYEDAVAGARVLDLFAGTGAMGLEALSRGASLAILVDDGTEARGLMRANVESLGVAGTTKILRRDATRLGAVKPLEPSTLVFCDPPYGKGLAERALASAAAGGWIAPEALVVVEEAAGAGFALPDGFELLDRRDYGESQVMFARFA